jgi:hypothetical protein
MYISMVRQRNDPVVSLSENLGSHNRHYGMGFISPATTHRLIGPISGTGKTFLERY